MHVVHRTEDRDAVLDDAALLWAFFAYAEEAPVSPDTRDRLSEVGRSVERHIGELGWDDAELRRHYLGRIPPKERLRLLLGGGRTGEGPPEEG
jgi:hypothetical protein